MDERFKELAKQADRGYTGQENLHGLCDSLVGNDSIEKFAKLIVKECADSIRKNFDHELAEVVAVNLEIEFGIRQHY